MPQQSSNLDVSCGKPDTRLLEAIVFRAMFTMRWFSAAIITLLAASTLLAGQSADDTSYRLHSRIPLGVEAFTVEGAWKGTLTLLASAQSPQFEGWNIEKDGHHYVAQTSNGQAVRYYPDSIDFRVTASVRSLMLDPSPFPVSVDEDQNAFLLGLRFRVVAFHGLRQTVIEPDSVELIGVPADLGSDERVYRVAVALPHISMQDRIVLEVYSPASERICKFHLDLL